MRRAELLVLALLSGCGRPAPPVIGAVAETVTLRETPPWLPAGWVEDPLPSALPAETGLTRRWSPQDAAAPLLMVSRYTVEQADALAAEAGQEPLLDWLAGRLTVALTGPGSRPGKRQHWRREGLRQGARIGLVGLWPEGDAGRLSGAVGVGQSFSGAVLIATALAPCRDDGSLDEESAALIDRLLAGVPIEQGLAVAVPEAASETDFTADEATERPATP